MTKSGAEKKRVRRSSGAIQNESNRDLNSDTPPRILNMAQDQGITGVVKQLDQACREAGFFYVKGHGIPDSIIKEVRNVAHKFFSLPYEEKLKIKISPTTGYRGYQQIGENITEGIPDMHEAIDDNYLKHFVDMVKKAKPVNGADVVQMVMCMSITKTRQILNVLHTNLAFLKNGRYIFTFAIGSGPVTGIIIPRLSSSRMRGKIMGFSFSVHWVLVVGGGDGGVLREISRHNIVI